MGCQMGRFTQQSKRCARMVNKSGLMHNGCRRMGYSGREQRVFGVVCHKEFVSVLFVVVRMVQNKCGLGDGTG